jgi:hypothetical protein
VARQTTMVSWDNAPVFFQLINQCIKTKEQANVILNDETLPLSLRFKHIFLLRTWTQPWETLYREHSCRLDPRAEAEHRQYWIVLRSQEMHYASYHGNRLRQMFAFTRHINRIRLQGGNITKTSSHTDFSISGFQV